MTDVIKTLDLSLPLEPQARSMLKREHDFKWHCSTHSPPLDVHRSRDIKQNIERSASHDEVMVLLSSIFLSHLLKRENLHIEWHKSRHCPFSAENFEY